MGATKKRPVGRPLDLHRIIIEATDQHDAITVEDQLVDAIRVGTPVHVAAAYAGIADSTLDDYLRTGARTLIKQSTGNYVTGDFTPKELACAEFSGRCTQARAEFQYVTMHETEQVARGGIPTEVVTVREERQEVPVRDDDGVWLRDEDGNLRTEGKMVEVERTTRSSVTLPDANIGLKRLQMRHPEQYAISRVIVETSPLDAAAQIDPEEGAGMVLDHLRSWQRSIGAESTDVTDDDTDDDG